MIRAEVKAELERIHGLANKPDDFVFEQSTEELWCLLSCDETKAEEMREAYSEIGSDLGMDGIYTSVKLTIEHVFPSPS